MIERAEEHQRKKRGREELNAAMKTCVDKQGTVRNIHLIKSKLLLQSQWSLDLIPFGFHWIIYMDCDDIFYIYDVDVHIQPFRLPSRTVQINVGNVMKKTNLKRYKCTESYKKINK